MTTMRSLRRSPEAPLAALAAAATAAFVWLPARLAGSGPRSAAGLTDAAADAVATYWQAGQRPLSPTLDALVDYWRRYHAVKAVAAALATVALALLAAALWRRAGRRRGRGLAAAAGAWSALALAGFGVLLVMANVQGTLSPLASVLSLLPVAAPSGRFAATAEQMRAALAAGGDAGASPLQAMVADFARYHAVLAALAAAAVCGVLALCVRAWRGRAAWGRRRAGAVVGVLFAAALAVVAAANVSTALEPSRAFASFLAG